MKVDIKCNVKIGHDGLVYQYQAGVHEDIPTGVAEALIKDGLATEVKAEPTPKPEKPAPKKAAAKVEE